MQLFFHGLQHSPERLTENGARLLQSDIVTDIYTQRVGRLANSAQPTVTWQRYSLEPMQV